MQGLLALECGADYIAPYFNRMENLDIDSFDTISYFREAIDENNYKGKILAASFKNAEQVHKCALAGCQCVTVTDDVLKATITHPMTDAAVAGFEKDWKNVYGDKTILDF